MLNININYTFYSILVFLFSKIWHKVAKNDYIRLGNNLQSEEHELFSDITDNFIGINF